MFLTIFLKGFPSRAADRWESDVGGFAEEQWEEVLQAVPACSLSVSQRMTQLYITQRVHLTPVRLFKMGLREDPLCDRYPRDHGDLIYLLWRCPKLHLYWSGVLNI